MARTVLVTGASTGIGLACSLRLASEGWHVLACVRTPDQVSALRALEVKGLVPLLGDVTNDNQIADAVAHATSGLDAVVCNAGVSRSGPVELLRLNDWQHVLDVNLLGSIRVVRAALPDLALSEGRVVLLGSMSGRVAAPLMGPYSASKFAVTALADCMRAEFRSMGVGVVLVEPGQVATAIFVKARADLAEMRMNMSPEQLVRYNQLLKAGDALVDLGVSRGLPASRVAEVVHRALGARHPRPCYAVGLDSHVTRLLGRLLPPRALDLTMRSVGRVLGQRKRA